MNEINETGSPNKSSGDKSAGMLSGEDGTSSLPSGTFSGEGRKINWTRTAEIVGIIGGLLALLLFLAGIVVTQNNMNSSIQDVAKSVDGYKTDNILQRVQIENWFNKMDTKLDYIKDRLKK